MSDYLDINNEELLKDFFSEAEQQVLTLESNILVIENDPANHEAIDEIFRAAHTLKGGSATVEMHELAEFTHIVEDLLDEIRSGTVSVTGEVVDVLLRSLDVIKAMLDARSRGAAYDANVDSLKEELLSFIPARAPKQKTPSKKASAAPKAAPSPAAQDTSQLLSEYELLELKESVPPGSSVYLVTVLFDEANPMNTVGGIQVFASLKQSGQVLKTIPDFDALYEDVFHERVLYFVASDADADALSKAASISDVTLQAEAVPFQAASSVKQSPRASTASGAAAPAAESPRAVKPESASAPAKAAAGKPAAAPVPLARPVSEVSADASSDDSQGEEGDLPADMPTEGSRRSSSQGAAQAHSAGSVLRVDSRRIDYLLNLVSETVITKASFNQSAIHFTDLLGDFQQLESQWKERLARLLDSIPEYLERIQGGESVKDLKRELTSEYADIFAVFDPFESAMKASVTKFRSSAQNLGRITGELQEGVMKIRMVPISQIFSRFPRLVRDLSHDLQKKVKLVIEGEDTELDKSVVEDLLDPIMHCVRNAIDHGVEEPAERAALGKSEEGMILLKASNEGNMIIIEIADDGHGIDVEAVKKKAVSRGIIHPGKNLSDVEAFQLIFEPGFSTADRITNISGRGVGLDVVRTHIEKLNGTVTITSQKNLGSRFTIRLPLTLAIIQGLLVRVGREVYSIPITSVIESHRVKPSDISRIDNYEVFNVRNEVISLLRLNRLFGIKTQESSEYSYIVIVGTAEKKIGLMVDSLIGEEDVVIKPLRDQFTNSPGIAGASILGDGSVSLIIDVSQLLDLGLKQEIQARERREASVW